MKNPLIVLSISIIITSCLAYGNDASSQYSVLRKESCDETPTELYLFFEGEQLDFSYEKLGLIEIQGAQYDSNQQLLALLKKEAANNCANGIIKIDQSFRDRTEGIVFASETEETYSSKVLTGIAVSIDENKVFLQKYENQAVEVSVIK